MQTRRELLKTFSASCLSTGLSCAGYSAVSEGSILVNSVSSIRNPWLAWWDRGGRSFAKAAGLSENYFLCQTENSLDMTIKQLRGIASSAGGRAVFNINGASSDHALEIVQLLTGLKANFVTHFYLPKGHEWKSNPYHVAHIQADEESFAASTAAYLLTTAGGKGRFVALGGNSVDEPARRRKAGLEAFVAKSPGMELIAFENGNWEAPAAFELTRWWLAKYERNISGIWAANDDMALGAIEALRTKSLAGKIPVTGMDGLEIAVSAIRKGELLATTVSDAFWLGGIGLSMANGAREGKIDVLSLPAERRIISGLWHLITRDNADGFAIYRGSPDARVDWSDWWPNDPQKLESSWPRI
jgi:ribose transport system substrate-binding protein